LRHQSLIQIFFQFLWGWNVNIFSWHDYIDEELSIPLRMKLGFSKEKADRIALYFQFLWGWNDENAESRRKRIRNFQFLWGWNTKSWFGRRISVKTFNSFEDETGQKVTLALKDINFQFLWGWNIMTIIMMDMKSNPKPNFQFLWGWNIRDFYGVAFCTSAFNSFEDETRLMTTTWQR